ncbi:uncharacterized protein TNCV_4951411 [Trichonephila clavipes]|nr:uncharacterized protein TNCV_4951411 [Trichonephila clavipes]
MAPHIITLAVGAVCRYKAKAGLRLSPQGLHTRTLDSSLRTNWFHSVAQSIFLTRGTTPNEGIDEWASRAAHVMGTVIPNVIQPGTFVWFEKTQGPLVKVQTPWMAADEAVACMCAFLTMWRSSRLLICRRYPEPGLRVNDISRIHLSQNLLRTRSELPN